ncbi:MAG: hypothetical protein FJZ96_10585 [Chloroflexi bacterium]|nr:hypothetical protein [Chloroflexota bacterium]
MPGKYRVLCVLSVFVILGALTACGGTRPNKDFIQCEQTAEILRTTAVQLSLPWGDYPDEPPPAPLIDNPQAGDEVEVGVDIIFHMPVDSPGGVNYYADVNSIYGGYLAIANVDDPSSALFEDWLESGTDPVTYHWNPPAIGLYVIMVLVDWENTNWMGSFGEGEYVDTYLCVEVTEVLPSALQMDPLTNLTPEPLAIPPLQSFPTTTPTPFQGATHTQTPLPTVTRTPTRTPTKLPPTSTFTPPPPPSPTAVVVDCSVYMDERSCTGNPACYWYVPPQGGPGSCKNTTP